MDHPASVLFQFWVEFRIASCHLGRRYFVRPPVAPVVDGGEQHLLFCLLVRLVQDVEKVAVPRLLRQTTRIIVTPNCEVQSKSAEWFTL